MVNCALKMNTTARLAYFALDMLSWVVAVTFLVQSEALVPFMQSRDMDKNNGETVLVTKANQTNAGWVNSSLFCEAYFKDFSVGSFSLL